MNAAKAFILVDAGVIPGAPLEEYAKRWDYTSSDYEKDRQTPADQPTIFSKMLDEAHHYAKGLSNPAYVNWVHVQWLWI